MARTHPQWLKARDIALSGRIGQLRGSGGLLQLLELRPGEHPQCRRVGRRSPDGYRLLSITLSRMLYGEEPSRVIGLVERDQR